MVKINEILEYEDKKLKRLSLTSVKSLLHGNELFNRKENKKTWRIYAIPCKANINSLWVEFFEKECVGVEDFEKWVNEVMYYNCNNEMGRYLHYYIEKR